MRVLVFLLLCVSCASSRGEGQSPVYDPQAPSDETRSAIRFAGGSGATCDLAIQISAPTRQTGVQASYDWLRDHRLGYQVIKRSLIDCSDHPTDQMTIVMPDGRHEDIFFAISVTSPTNG